VFFPVCLWVPCVCLIIVPLFQCPLLQCPETPGVRASSWAVLVAQPSRSKRRSDGMVPNRRQCIIVQKAAPRMHGPYVSEMILRRDRHKEL